MSELDFIKNNGLSPSGSPSDPLDPPRVLNSRVAAHVEDFFRWEKHISGGRRASKEALATVCCPSTTP